MNGYDLAMQQEAQEASLTNDKITEILTSLNNQYSDMHYTTSNIWDMIYYYNLNIDNSSSQIADAMMTIIENSMYF